jgi:mannitol/fructose-specific phosphotransferase system IIA component
MAKNVEEALNEAIAELKKNEDVVDIEYLPDSVTNEKKPCKYVAKILCVFHKVDSETHTFSHKIVYINTDDFSYKWGEGGLKVNKMVETKPTNLTGV